MNEYPPATGTTAYQDETSILENPYEREVQLDIWQHERKKTMMSIIAIGAIILVSNLIGFSVANVSIIENWLVVLLFPVLFFGLGVFARLQPLIAAKGSIALILAIAIIEYIAVGPNSLISGWIYKVIALYFIITGFRHAKEAEAAKKKLAELG